MATLNYYGPNGRILSDAYTAWPRGFAEIETLSASETRIIARNPATEVRIVLKGTGFAYDAQDGTLIDGTIHEVALRQNGQLQARIVKLDWDAAAFGPALADAVATGRDAGQIDPFIEQQPWTVDARDARGPASGVTFGQIAETRPVVFKGSPFADDLSAGAASDRLFGKGGADTLRGGARADKVYGGGGDDTLYGEDGRDLILGGAGIDWISGGRGSDRIRGGEGDDRMFGDAGRDVFIFAGRGYEGNDLIFDFESGRDHIRIGAGLRFEDLTIAGDATQTVISLETGTTVTLQGVDVNDIDAGDFIFV
ncbi:calcium-binding protein [Oceanicella actignis]|uniref:Hemolysin-type calcium-binding repeat-containing protein n=1 Tax=Oceanicella actignis TaxID=1189325 RepID=A0A1M7TWU7_9RHOB|nr:hypothetical protein [Oceanicella actignis]SET79666.1 Hemolysin-type calcium-binding repeat-containing protein [Oceanicella actignis]SHN75214.1 Hemolysin-type calcium-binding repeat-containing protein [Oceanicella actignis]